MAHDETPSRTNGETSLALVGGQELTIVDRDSGQLLVLRGSDRRINLTIEVTEKGPVVRLEGPALTIETSGPLSIQAQELALHGREGLRLSSGGDASVSVQGDLDTSARVQNIRAELGNVNVSANDNVRLVGERVLLNC